jgi:hypothetical protein
MIAADFAADSLQKQPNPERQQKPGTGAPHPVRGGPSRDSPIQPVREFHLFFTCINRWRSAMARVLVVGGRWQRRLPV